MTNPIRTRRRFTAQQKAEAVESYLQESPSWSAVAQSLRLPSSRLARWVWQARAGNAQAGRSPLDLDGTWNSPRPGQPMAPWTRLALPALLLPSMPLVLGLPALAAPIDMICSLPPASSGGLGTLVDFSLREGSGSGSSFWPASGQRRTVVAQISAGQIVIMQHGSGDQLFSINRLNGSITTPGGESGRCTNAGPMRVDRAI